MKRIKVAETAGFCFGVDRAVQLVYRLLREGNRVCTLGPIIHNPQVVEDLAQKGARTVLDIDEVTDGEILVIRSHGVPKETMEEIQTKGIPCYDATCPFVAKIHNIVARESEQGAIVLICGDTAHPEVIGIRGYISGISHVISTPEDFEQLQQNHPEYSNKKVILVAQTTFNETLWKSLVEIAKKAYTNAAIFDTICSATTQRQHEAVALAKESDYMIVIGGKQSSNTLKLKEICEHFCDTDLIETAVELDKGKLACAARIGVTAGASTPADIIKEVRNIMSDVVKNPEEEMSFEELLEQSLDEKLYTGKRVTGVVTAISPNEVQIDVGAKQSGYVPAAEWSDDPNLKLEESVKKEDEVELIVMKVNDQEGTVMLSKRRRDAEAGFDEIIKAHENNETMHGVIVDVVRGGVLVLTHNVKLFIPASQVSTTRVEDLKTLLRQEVDFKILEINEGRRRAIGSVKAVLREQRDQAREKFWETVEVGQKYTGTVKSITSYGAFVDLGGVDGMIHITELSWTRIKHPSEIVNIGDTVEVYVKDLDPENKKISLGYKKTEDNPWNVLQTTYQVGDVVKVKVVSLTQYGAFAQVIPGIDGLIHISQISTERINKASDALEVGQEVEVKITDIDYDAKRVSLSIRALLEENAPKEDFSKDVADVEGVEVTSDDAVEEEVAEAEVEAPVEETAEAEEAPAEDAEEKTEE